MKRPRRTVIVAGNGMVGLRFCRELTDRAPDRFDVTVLAEEDVPAYDRVRLTRLLRGRRFDDLMLEPRTWYEERGIDLQLADAVVDIDRKRTEVRTRRGRTLSYDTLVLATGAGTARPTFPGADLPGVLPYRTATDLLAVQLRAARSTHAVVLGGGLVGVEVATALLALGLDTTVVEAGPHLLHRQLDRPGAELVHAELERQGGHIVSGRRVRAIRERGIRLAIELDRDPVLVCDLVVVAAGARPRDELARDAGLCVDDVRGGVKVDDLLCTSDPRVLAIGDCARHDGETPGSLSPGYRMAEIAARRLAGENARFTGCETSIHFSVAGIDVAALGDHAGGGRRLVFHDGGARRAIVLRDGRVTGVSAVGPWAGLTALEEALRARRRLTAAEIARFSRSGDPFPASRSEARADAALLCHCASVSCGAVRAAMARGCTTVTAIGAATGAGTSCGTCRPQLVQLLAAGGGVTSIRPGPDRAPPRGRWSLALMSLLALVACGVFVLAGRQIAAAGAEAARWLLELPGTSSKVVSGAVLVATASLGLILSLRKRLPRLRRLGNLRWFRLMHAAVGLASIALVVGHTGMRTGDNLNLVLLVAFLGVIASGATVGVAAVAPASARALPVLMWGHLLFLWVLPVLISFHVVAVYWF